MKEIDFEVVPVLRRTAEAPQKILANLQQMLGQKMTERIPYDYNEAGRRDGFIEGLVFAIDCFKREGIFPK